MSYKDCNERAARPDKQRIEEMTTAMPTKAQMDQVAQQAVSAFAEMMGISEVEAIESHSDSIFKLVCAYAAQEA